MLRRGGIGGKGAAPRINIGIIEIIEDHSGKLNTNELLGVTRLTNPVLQLYIFGISHSNIYRHSERWCVNFYSHLGKMRYRRNISS